ncbi:hypothetical protein EI94DRAFT_1703825 [Lactarius quietus]|nr:hypothetical protein EI94DRAFT_1703825 [Lactarius quietus]
MRLPDPGVAVGLIGTDGEPSRSVKGKRVLADVSEGRRRAVEVGSGPRGWRHDRGVREWGGRKGRECVGEGGERRQRQQVQRAGGGRQQDVGGGSTGQVARRWRGGERGRRREIKEIKVGKRERGGGGKRRKGGGRQ